MKSVLKRTAALMLSLCICLTAAACGSAGSGSETKTEEDELKEAYNELDESDKKELDELREEIEKEEQAETTTTAAKATAAAATTAPEPADLGLKDPKYYTYYEDLAKNYSEYTSQLGVGALFDDYTNKPMYYNGKVYYTVMQETDSGTSTAIVYCYDIESKTLKKEFEDMVVFQDNYRKYLSWFVKNDDLYLLYTTKNNPNKHIIKIDKKGDKADFELTDDESSRNIYGYIDGICENGKIIISTGLGLSVIVDMKTKTITPVSTLTVPSEHAGVTKDVSMNNVVGIKGNSFYFWGYEKFDNTLYEYNTDTDEITVAYQAEDFTYDSVRNNALKIYGDYLYYAGKLVKISDGTTVFDKTNLTSFFNYHGGDASYYMQSGGNIYKFQIPDSSCKEPLNSLDDIIDDEHILSAHEPTMSTDITVLTDKYYIVEDDAGWFIRTFEKGDSEEEVFLTKKQIEEDAAAAE